MRRHDEAEIRALIKARNDAVYAGDTHGALESLAEDVVAYDLQPPLLLVGPDARDAHAMAEWLATWDGPVRIEMSHPRVAVDGQIAFAHGLSLMEGTTPGQGKRALWFRSTLCFKRAAGRWSVVHEHHSVPMRMDGSGLAATDLTPETTAPN